MTKFKDLGLNDDVLKGITDQGYEDAFPIQEAVIPILLSKRDVVGPVSYTHLTLPTILLV